MKDLSEIETRILGSLVEKEITTPDYYPLTLNALTNACNQKNNRDPVVSFDEASVLRGIEQLRERKLVSTVTGAGIRVPKYKHSFRESYDLTAEETSVLCLLMLRGPQTVGELRNRSGPMHSFATLDDVQRTLDTLQGSGSRREMVVRLPRQAGHKEARYAHLLAGEPRIEKEENPLGKLQDDFKALEARVDMLTKEFGEFRKLLE